MQGFILYEGPSAIDGNPIVAIATGLARGSSNIKTGPMAQIYIIRADVHPLQAVQTGDDVSICGSCRHRGTVVTDDKGSRRNVGRSCYVTVMHGPSVVYRAFGAGVYKHLPPKIAQRALANRPVRVGAYGDPGAVPMPVWDMALDRVTQLTAYTHLWREFPALSAFCMASCDTADEREEAKLLGFRTFRVRSKDDATLKGEGRCPASDEVGRAVQCLQCMLCGGARRDAQADITIIAHGSGARHFEEAS